jgi:hypothetical protein
MTEASSNVSSPSTSASSPNYNPRLVDFVEVILAGSVDKETEGKAKIRNYNDNDDDDEDDRNQRFADAMERLVELLQQARGLIAQVDQELPRRNMN